MQGLLRVDAAAIDLSSLSQMRRLSSPNALFLQSLQLYKQGYFSLPFSIFQKTLERLRQVGDRAGEAKTLYYLGLNHEALNQRSQALASI